MIVNGSLVEDKMRRFKGEYAHCSFNKCLIYTHDSASAKFSNNSHEMDNSSYDVSLNDVSLPCGVGRGQTLCCDWLDRDCTEWRLGLLDAVICEER